jgi:hypothetical protein
MLPPFIEIKILITIVADAMNQQCSACKKTEMKGLPLGAKV